MTVIVWDGKTLAADKQATCGELRTRTTKVRKLPSGHVIACTRGLEEGLAVMDWYANGADPKDWPASQNTEDWARLVVATPAGVFHYEKLPIKQHIEDPFAAWGSGRDYALAALEMGADSIKAVEVASKFCTSVGLGCDAFRVNP